MKTSKRSSLSNPEFVTNNSKRLRTVGVSVLFGLIAIACSGATVAEVAVAPDTAVPAQVDQVDSTQQDEPEIELVEATTTTAIDATTEAPPAAEIDAPSTTAASTTSTPATTTSTTSTPTTTTPTTTTPTTTTEAAAEVSPLFAGAFVDLNGQSIALADFEGEDVVLWFWAPW